MGNLKIGNLSGKLKAYHWFEVKKEYSRLIVLHIIHLDKKIVIFRGSMKVTCSSDELIFVFD